ncbi:translation initiation factor IF-2-like [Dryobates pubescens]|uniref:translation initiation factor IF-2-like n=1 Tax=Dryobates pubescens TaxID=118200 RepID=UPI0023B8F081|nr:translation initiation factor IF-2-like [Dryobates pubescens]
MPDRSPQEGLAEPLYRGRARFAQLPAWPAPPPRPVPGGRPRLGSRAPRARENRNGWREAGGPGRPGQPRAGAPGCVAAAAAACPAPPDSCRRDGPSSGVSGCTTPTSLSLASAAEPPPRAGPAPGPDPTHRGCPGTPPAAAGGATPAAAISLRSPAAFERTLRCQRGDWPITTC